LTYIGILLDPPKFNGIPNGNTSYERIPFYNKAAISAQMYPFYMTLPKINVEKNTAIGYEWRNNRYKLIRKNIPYVIHNRSMPATQEMRIRLSSLKKKKIVYNQQTRYSKQYINQLLSKNKSLLPFIPTTVPYSNKNLINMMIKFNSLFIKPISGSLGKGIIKLKKQNENIWLVQTAALQRNVTTNDIIATVSSLIGNRPYLIQETIPLATYNGSPYDLRVSVQRSKNGNWQVTGMVGKVAGEGKHVTNVASGGTVQTSEKLFTSSGLNVTTVKKSINRLSLNIAKELSKTLPGLADVGLDVGIDKKGKPYFIELNGRDLRYSFKNGGLMKEWYKTFENPILYGKYLYQINQKKG